MLYLFTCTIIMSLRAALSLKGPYLSRCFLCSVTGAPLSPTPPPHSEEEGEGSFRSLYNLPAIVSENLENHGLIYPTEIQKMSLNSLLSPEEEIKRCTIINSETGSGKTLCFLLPILKLFGDLWLKEGSIPAATAAILVPSPHLAQQVNDVFRSLADPNWNTSMAAFSHASFSFNKTSHLLIAVPGKLKDYGMERIFSNNRLLCLDEADILLNGGESSTTKHILKFIRSEKPYRHRQPTAIREDERVGESSHHSKHTASGARVIMTAATLPSRGPEYVGNQIFKLFPRRSVAIFKTGNTHKTLPMAELKFVPCKDLEAKFARLVEDLDALGESNSSSGDGNELPKVLIFANTVKNAVALTNFFSREHGSTLPPSSQQHGPPSTRGTSKWWAGRVGAFFKQPGVFNEQREQVLREFRQGSVVRVLVCSDLGSRGLDFPDCGAVIQFDFPENSEHFLHRAGRTARAGRSGKVISYIMEADKDVAHEIQKIAMDRSSSFDSVFSRNKMLRRRINRRKETLEAKHDDIDTNNHDSIA